MPAFYIAQIKITDREKYAQVQGRFQDVFQKYQARVVAADANFEVLDGSCDASRVVILEFESAAELKRWYFSEEYQETVELRRAAADANVVLVHGL